MKAIICDLDGTLCLFKHHRGPYDARTCENDLPNKAVLEIVKRFSTTHTIIFTSGRSDEFAEQTVSWLMQYVFGDTPEGYELLMRNKGDIRKDSVVKNELYEKFIKDKYDVLFVLDDRDQVVEMWRSIGLSCLQVAPGNF